MAISAPAPARMPLLPAWAWWVVAICSSALCALLTLQSIQVAATFVSVACVVGIYLASRRAGLAAVWLLWLLVPAVRRLLGLSEGFESADPLAVAPFAATGIVAAIELGRVQLSQRARRVLYLGGAGFVFGVPVGLTTDPTAAGFALLAYLAGVLTFAIGYNEPVGGELSLARILAVAAVPVALYGIVQVAAPLPAWDREWLEAAEFVSAGNEADNTLRAFGTLNGPGTLAAVLGLAVLFLMTVRRFGPLQAGALVVLLVGLGATLVRSVWVAVVFALLVLVIVSPGRLGRRVLIVAAVGVLAFPLALGGSSVGTKVEQRAGTLTAVGEDSSARARIATPGYLVPIAIQLPFGVGLGQAGEASRLADTSVLRATDNAWLSMLLQLGPAGLLILVAGVAAGIASAVRTALRTRTPNALAVLGALAMIVVLSLTGDVFYGIAGVVLWYLIGVAVRADDAIDRGKAG